MGLTQKTLKKNYKVIATPCEPTLFSGDLETLDLDNDNILRLAEYGKENLDIQEKISCPIKNNKSIFIVNGSGGVGKDTFVNSVGELTKISHVSIVDFPKIVSTFAGWTGEKTEKDRKFLSDIKIAIDEYNDGNYTRMKQKMQEFRGGKVDANILFIDMREKEQIERAVKEFGAKTVLVTRNSVKQITTNIADNGVYDMLYDFNVDNNGTLEELKKSAETFLDESRRILIETEIK